MAFIITGPGNYVTRNGRLVTIRSVDGRGTFCAQGAIWRLYRGRLRLRGYDIWRPDGAYKAVGQSGRDIVSAA